METAKCVICGVEYDADSFMGTKSDHLRTLCLRNGKLERGYFLPRLDVEEQDAVQRAVYVGGSNEQRVCSNRAACRERNRVRLETK